MIESLDFVLNATGKSTGGFKAREDKSYLVCKKRRIVGGEGQEQKQGYSVKRHSSVQGEREM